MRVKVVHLHVLRSRTSPPDGEFPDSSRGRAAEPPELAAPEFEPAPDFAATAGDAAAEPHDVGDGDGFSDLAAAFEPPDAAGKAAAAPARRAAHPKTWRWVRPPSPAAVIARALEPRGRPLDPVRLLARHPAPAAPAPRQRDSAAQFWSIWLAHRDYLRQHSLRLSRGNVADAEDALSEAMLKAAQAFAKTEIRNERAWLLRLVHNSCMDRYRNNHRHQRIARDISGEGAESVPVIAARGSRTPEDLLLAIEQIASLQRAMGALPRMLAEPLLLYLNDLSDDEIAGSLQVSKEVVRKRRQIARAWLRRHTSS